MGLVRMGPHSCQARGLSPTPPLHVPRVWGRERVFRLHVPRVWGRERVLCLHVRMGAWRGLLGVAWWHAHTCMRKEERALVI